MQVQVHGQTMFWLMLHQNHNRRLLWASLVYMRQAISFVVGLAA